MPHPGVLFTHIKGQVSPVLHLLPTVTFTVSSCHIIPSSSLQMMVLSMSSMSRNCQQGATRETTWNPEKRSSCKAVGIGRPQYQAGTTLMVCQWSSYQPLVRGPAARVKYNTKRWSNCYVEKTNLSSSEPRNSRAVWQYCPYDREPSRPRGGRTAEPPAHESAVAICSHPQGQTWRLHW